jgi:hypothetical protein
MIRGRTNGIVASVGTAVVAAALVLLWAIRLQVPRDLYVSELGATGMPTARPFEVFLLLIVVGGVLVAWAGRGIRSRARIIGRWTPAVSLWIACAFFLVDSQVTCTAGCPVPVPGPLFTWQDFTHTTVAVLAFAAAAIAILQCAFADGHRALRRLSLACAVAVGLVSAVGGLMSLLDFYSWFGSRLELVATTVGLGWMVVFGRRCMASRRRSASTTSRWISLSSRSTHRTSGSAPTGTKASCCSQITSVRSAPRTYCCHHTCRRYGRGIRRHAELVVLISHSSSTVPPEGSSRSRRPSGVARCRGCPSAWNSAVDGWMP